MCCTASQKFDQGVTLMNISSTKTRQWSKPQVRIHYAKPQLGLTLVRHIAGRAAMKSHVTRFCRGEVEDKRHKTNFDFGIIIIST